MVSNVLMCS